MRPAFSSSTLQAKHRKIAVMYCEDESDWRNEIKLEEAEFLDDARYTGGTGGCGGVDVHTAKAWFFEPPTPQSWKNVLTFQEQAVLVAAAGSGNCITFQERTVCTPRVGTADSTQVCATVTTTSCQCSCSCDCNCGDSGGGYPSSGGGSGGSGNCNCSCTCHANSIISFG